MIMAKRRNIQKEVLPPKNKLEVPNWEKASQAFERIVTDELEEIKRLCNADTYKDFGSLKA